MKQCRKCQEEKSSDGFYKDKRMKDGLRSYCKDCEKARHREKYNKDPEKYREKVRKYYHESRDKVAGKETKRKWRLKNREKIREYQRERRNNNPLVKLSVAIRRFSHRITNAVKQDKELRSLEYLGCTVEEFRSHIESLWAEGMTWENHGDWHIDHIVPIDWYVKNSDDPWEANHYSNLQPLWATDNLSKGSSF